MGKVKKPATPSDGRKNAKFSLKINTFPDGKCLCYVRGRANIYPQTWKYVYKEKAPVLLHFFPQVSSSGPPIPWSCYITFYFLSLLNIRTFSVLEERWILIFGNISGKKTVQFQRVYFIGVYSFRADRDRNTVIASSIPNQSSRVNRTLVSFVWAFRNLLKYLSAAFRNHIKILEYYTWT